MRIAAFALLAVLLVPAASAQKSCLSGNCENGQGRARYDFDSGNHEIYEGRFLRGEPTGEGSLSMSTGWTYAGQFSGRLLDGTYLATHTNGQQERVRFDEGAFVEVVERIRGAGGGAATSSNRGLEIGSSISASLSGSEAAVALTASGDDRPVDAYDLILRPGQTATVRMESSDFDPYLLVHRGGEFVVRNDDFGGSRSVSQVEVVAPAAATGTTMFTVYAGPFSANGTGAYTLDVTGTVGTPRSTSSGSALVLDAAATSGTISPSDPRVPLNASDDLRPADAYTLSLAAGQTATVRMESSNFDTYLKVVRDGVFVERNDDFGSTSVSQLEITAPTAGTYTVYAGTFTEAGTGAYLIRATSSGRAPAQSAASGPTASGQSGETVVQGTLTDDDAVHTMTLADDLRKADNYLIAAGPGQRIIVEMTSEAFDTYLRLERNGVKVAYNDDAGSTSRSSIEATAELGGVYMLYAGTFSATGRGAYTLRYRVE